ncbi:MAG: LysM peptidoglycan-binding domain-containing protein [Bacteroidia bacterium]|nr:LysM peptidoglycan-binding domain-containing protein [Bacteroidia bacterium]
MMGYKNEEFGYMFKHQGQESDDEVYGEGAAYFYTYRMSDSRYGRFWSVDPITCGYPHNSPYAFAENKVGLGKEFEGLELMPFVLGSNTTLFGITDLMIMESSISRVPTSNFRPYVRPVAETVVKTNLARPTGGTSTTMMRYGRLVHNEKLGRWAENGWEIEQFLGRINGRGNRLDGLKIERLANGDRIGRIRELKPNNSWGRNAGFKQLERYIEAAKNRFPGVKEWIPELHLYESAGSVVVGLFYTVQPGDNLSKIAAMYGTTVEDLVKLNNIEDPNKILVGETFLVDFEVQTQDSNTNTDSNNTNSNNTEDNNDES